MNVKSEEEVHLLMFFENGVRTHVNFHASFSTHLIFVQTEKFDVHAQLIFAHF